MRLMRPSSRPASLALQCFIALLVVALVRPPPVLASPPEVVTELALGAGSPRIAVVVVSQDLRASQQQGALEGAAEAALERSARFTVIPVHDAFNPTAAKRQEANVEESREKMKVGKQALDDLDNVKATEVFTQAVESLQASDLSRNFPALLEAWTMKAAGHATGGENGPAKKDIESVVGLSPKAEFTPTFFPPDLIKFAEAQRKFAANAKGELLVRTEPPGARVWVDGLYRGVSPVTVAGLTGAKHFIAASEGGYALGQSQAGPGEEVISLAAAELGPGWKKATNDIKKDPEGSTRDSAAQTLGKAAQLEQVLLVLSKKSVAGEQLELIGIRLETRDGHNAAYRTATVNPGDPEALATFFDGLTGKDAKRDGKDPVHHFKGGGGSPIKTIAGISLLGLAAASLVSGITFGILASDKASIWKQTAQTMSFNSGLLKTDGQTFAAVADISYIIALLSAAGGTVLLLTNGPSSGASDEPATSKKSGKASTDDLKRQQLDRKAAEDRRAAEERTKDDERRRDEERKRDEDRKKEGDTKAADDKRRAEEEEARKAEEEAARKKEEEKPTKKLSKKEQAALDKKQREEEKRAAAEEKKREEEEEKARKAEEKNSSGKLTKKQQKEEDERKKKEEDAKAEEERKKADEEAAKKKKDDEERKKREEAEKKKKTEDHDDLRNF